VPSYIPDRWVIIKTPSVEDTLRYRVFAGWYGMYVQTARWRASSGITKIERMYNDDGEEIGYEIHNFTGSVYECFDASFGMSAHMQSILGDWEVVSIQEAQEAIQKGSGGDKEGRVRGE
jgi:hypothetical protein